MRQGSLTVTSNLIILIIVILIVTLIILKLQPGAAVRIAGDMYDHFFPSEAGGKKENLLTLEDGRLILHREWLAREERLVLITFTPDGDFKSEYTRDTPLELPLPDSFITLYGLAIKHDNQQEVQRYIFINPKKEQIPFGEVSRGITLALRHGATLEDLRDLFSQYDIAYKEKKVSLRSFLSPITPVCSGLSGIKFSTCKKRDYTHLFFNKMKREEDQMICLIRVWDGHLPEGVRCGERPLAREEYQYGGRLLLLLNTLRSLGVTTLPPPLDCSREESIRNILTDISFLMGSLSEKNRDDLKRILEFYSENIIFSSSQESGGTDCITILHLQGDWMLSRLS